MIEPAARDRAHAITRWFHEIWHEGSDGIIDHLLPDGAQVHGLTRRPITGPEAFKRFARAGRAAHRDVEVQVEDVRAATLQATAQIRVSAVRRHTGRSVSYCGAFLVHFDAHGKIAEAWFTADTSRGRV